MLLLLPLLFATPSPPLKKNKIHRMCHREHIRKIHTTTPLFSAFQPVQVEGANILEVHTYISIIETWHMHHLFFPQVPNGAAEKPPFVSLKKTSTMDPSREKVAWKLALRKLFIRRQHVWSHKAGVFLGYLIRGLGGLPSGWRSMSGEKERKKKWIWQGKSFKHISRGRGDGATPTRTRE